MLPNIHTMIIRTMNPAVTPSDGATILNGYSKPKRKEMNGKISPSNLLSLLDKNICNTIMPTIKSKKINVLIMDFPLQIQIYLFSTFHSLSSNQ